MSEYRERLYNLERQYVEGILKEGVLSEAIHQDISNVLMETCNDFENKATRIVYYFFDLFHDVNFRSDFLREPANDVDPKNLSNQINKEEITQAKNYVERLLDVDLSSVSIIKLNEQIKEHAEGFCVPCGKEQHYIFYQDDKNGVISTDLIIHELGHAAEFTISRSEISDNVFNRHPCISEAIAYYCQFRYLLDFGTREQRMGSFGAFFDAYLKIIICLVCIKHKTPLSDIDIQLVVNSNECLPIINSYNQNSLYTKKFIADRVAEIKKTHPNLIFLVYHDIAPKFGAALAILLLNKPQHFIRKIIDNNIFEKDLKSLVEDIISGCHSSITDLETNFKQYFGSR